MSATTLYQEAVLDHHRNPRNHGELADPDAFAREDNPLCGDELALYLRFDGGGGGDVRLADVRFTGRGCALAIATASMLTERIRGRPLAELRGVDEALLLELLGVPVKPTRMKCVRLSLEVLRAALARYEPQRALRT